MPRASAGNGQVFSYSSSTVQTGGPGGVSYQVTPGYYVHITHCHLIAICNLLPRPVRNVSCVCLSMEHVDAINVLILLLTVHIDLFRCLVRPQATQTSRTGPGGVREVQKTVRDGRTGHEAISVARALGDR